MITKHVEGMKDVIAALRAERKDLERGAMRGLIRAGLTLQRDSQLIVPVDTGVLKNSAVTRHYGKGFDTEVTVSYEAEYAIYVHENLNALHGQAYNDAYIQEAEKGKKRDNKGKFLKNGGRQWTERAKKKGYHKDRTTGAAKAPNKRGANQTAKYLEKPLRANRRKYKLIVIEEMAK